MEAASKQQSHDVAHERSEKGTTPGFLLVVGKIFTCSLNGEQEWAEAMVIKRAPDADSQILFVGSEQKARGYLEAQNLKLNDDVEEQIFRQGMILPGFQDAHVHTFSGGMLSMQCNLSEEPFLSFGLKKVEEYCKDHPELEWIIGGGWHRNWFDQEKKEEPTAAILDAIVSDRPCLLKCFDGHSYWTNSKAMELIDVTNPAVAATVVNGHIQTDASGKPTGWFLEGAMDLFGKILEIEALPLERRMLGMQAGFKAVASFGITAFQDAWVRPGVLEVYDHWFRTQKLQARVSLSLRLAMKGDTQANLQWIEDASRGTYGRGLRVRTVKVMLDGVIETRTALMNEPYCACQSTFGLCNFDRNELPNYLTRLDKNGIQIHIHAIGDGAVKLALDSLEHVKKVNGPSKNRHHIAHLQVVDPRDIPRFKELDVCANFQPFWACFDDDQVKITGPLLGETRVQWQYPINSLLKSGAHVGFGSDWVVSSLNPLFGIQVAITRNLLDGTRAPFLPHEKITLKEALLAYTRGSAYINHLDQTGSLEVGKLADFIVLDMQLFEIPPDQIHKAKVLKTFVDGYCVYSST